MQSDSTIFISYRRGEQHPDEHVARNLHNSLAAEFGTDTVFRDVNDSHQLIGNNFREVLKNVIKQSTVCVVVIGPKWIKDISRLHNPDDFVRMEIEEFLKRPDVGVILVTVGGATYPNKSELPENLRSLLDYGGVTISNDSAEGSVDKIVAAINERNSPTKPFSKLPHIIPTALIAIVVMIIVFWFVITYFPNETYESCLEGATFTEKMECHKKYGNS